MLYLHSDVGMDLPERLALVQDADPQWDPWRFWTWQRGVDPLDQGSTTTVKATPLCLPPPNPWHFLASCLPPCAWTLAIAFSIP